MTSLYIHIPFCKSKCFYCSFASFEKRDELIAPYLKALGKEAEIYKGLALDSVYIGGGTPTYLNCFQLEELFSIVRRQFVLKQGCEMTMEANPATFDLEKARCLLNAGVNRVSLGVQSLNDKNLRFLGRPHSKSDAVSAFCLLRDAKFSNINLDLIYSLPGQSVEEIKKDTEELVSLASEHVSLYPLTIAEGSMFSDRRVVSVLPEEQAGQYSFVVGLLKKYGFRHYEVSNFSKAGFQCRHNTNYWSGGDYIGLGSAAHSHRSGLRFWNEADPLGYIKAIEENGYARAGEERLDRERSFMEAFLIGLRLVDGVEMKVLKSKFHAALPPEKEMLLKDFVREGLLTESGDRIAATFRGMVVLDEICSRLI